MASVSLLEGFAKKFINMVPRPFYTEAAQKLVHEICETIYKDLDEKDIFPRVEIIEIVEGFVNTHLNNTDTETPSGIRKAIEDNLAKTTLEIYKDEKINLLLLQSILSEEVGPDGTPKKDGIFYKSLDQSIGLTNGTSSDNSGGVDNKTDENGDTNKEKKETDKDSEKFAKKVVNELVNTTVEIHVIKGGAKVKNALGDAANKLNSITDGVTGAMDSIKGNITGAMDSITGDNPLLADALASAGSQMLNGSGSGNQPQITNIGYEENKNGVLPYIQTNCNGVGLGLPGIDLDFLAKIFDGLKKPIAEELVKKIQERLPDKTTDSFTVKAEIYEKILLVIQAHLQSQQGKDMLLGHIDRIIKKEVDILTTNDEIKKRLLKVIFKDKNSEIYKKLIEIIADRSIQIGAAAPPDDDKLKNEVVAAPTSDDTSTLQNGGKESKLFHVNTIETVIQDFSTWLNEKIGSTSKSVNETEVQPSVIPDNKYGGTISDIENAAVLVVDQQIKLQLSDDNIKNTSDKTLEAIPVTSNDNSTETNDSTIKVDVVDNPNLNENEEVNAQLSKGNESDVNNNSSTSKELSTITSNILSKSPIVENKKIPPIGHGKGGNPPKNKTKKRRTKNNKRKTSKTSKTLKQKRRVTKKKNRKYKK
jgi:hypothetical protein